MNNSKNNINHIYTQLKKGDRIALGKAITLVESNRQDDQANAIDLLNLCKDSLNKSFRIGVTGSPGVGKSTFINTFVQHLTQSNNKRVAVLTIDPSSQKSKGSILGDKTRMEDIASNEKVFIRPSSSGNTLGGVALKTREAILICEAAGYDYIIVETVGVGQSEISIKDMVDFVFLLVLPTAGDELQGIKRGIMESLDSLIIHKSDGDLKQFAKEAKSKYSNALHYFEFPESGFLPEILTCSSIEKTGFEEIIKTISDYKHVTLSNGFLKEKQRSQLLLWFKEHLNHALIRQLNEKKGALNIIKSAEDAVINKKILPVKASEEIVNRLLNE